MIPLAGARLSLLISVSWAKMLSPWFSFEDLIDCAPLRDQATQRDEKMNYFNRALYPSYPFGIFSVLLLFLAALLYADTRTNRRKSPRSLKLSSLFVPLLLWHFSKASVLDSSCLKSALFIVALMVAIIFSPLASCPDALCRRVSPLPSSPSSAACNYGLSAFSAAQT